MRGKDFRGFVHIYQTGFFLFCCSKKQTNPFLVPVPRISSVISLKDCLQGNLSYPAGRKIKMHFSAHFLGGNLLVLHTLLVTIVLGDLCFAYIQAAF